MWVLHIHHLRKRLGGRDVLDGVDLGVEPGEIAGLLGRNGAGKTTLMSILAGLLPADSGSVSVAGIDVSVDPRAARARLGLAPQELGVYPNATVRENLTLFGRLHALRRDRLRRAVADAAEGMAVTDLLDRRAGTLSGGQQRRVHAAIALLHRPPVVLLDEPTVGADVTTRATVIETVARLAVDGAAVLYTTHYLHELVDLHASIAVLEGGRVVARGGQAELLDRLRTERLPRPSLDDLFAAHTRKLADVA